MDKFVFLVPAMLVFMAVPWVAYLGFRTRDVGVHILTCALVPTLVLAGTAFAWGWHNEMTMRYPQGTELGQGGR